MIIPILETTLHLGYELSLLCGFCSLVHLATSPLALSGVSTTLLGLMIWSMATPVPDEEEDGQGLGLGLGSYLTGFLTRVVTVIYQIDLELGTSQWSQRYLARRGRLCDRLILEIASHGVEALWGLPDGVVVESVQLVRTDDIDLHQD